MHEVLVNRLGGLSLPRKSVVRLTDRPDMTLDVYRGRKTTIQQQEQPMSISCLLRAGRLTLHWAGRRDKDILFMSDICDKNKFEIQLRLFKEQLFFTYF